MDVDIVGPGSDFINKQVFHHVLKYFTPEEMLKLRVVDSTLQDRVMKEIFHSCDIFLHESTFRENLGEQMQSTKNLKIKGIQLREQETCALFNGLCDNLYKNVESLTLEFSVDDENEPSIDCIASKLALMEKCTKLELVFWEGN